ncbi:MAG: hypothetical protein AAF637_18190 [Pseudomonadota bacterium]
MRPSRIHVITALIAVGALTACAQTKRDEPPAAPATAAMEEGSFEGFQELALMVDGVEISRLVEDKAGLRTKVEELLDTDEPDPAQIRKWLDILGGGEGSWADVHPSLRGIAGLSVAQLLEAYLASQASTFLKTRVRGKIRDYLFDKDEAITDRQQGAGHLSVETWVDYFDSEASFAAETPDRTERYHWDIDVVRRIVDEQETQGFIVVERDDTQPTNPFPGTIEDLPQPMLDRIFKGEPDAVPPKPPLLNKLWAEGKDIVIRSVYRIQDDFTVELLPDTDPQYASTDASCIDMMWAADVPAVFTASSHPPNYCLGRCAHPLVVNTE